MFNVRLIYARLNESCTCQNYPAIYLSYLAALLIFPPHGDRRQVGAEPVNKLRKGGIF